MLGLKLAFLFSYLIFVNSNAIPEKYQKNAEQGDLYQGDIYGVVRNYFYY